MSESKYRIFNTLLLGKNENMEKMFLYKTVSEFDTILGKWSSLLEAKKGLLS